MPITRAQGLQQSLIGLLLLLWGNAALAFTIIEIPDESQAAGGTITDAITLNSQFQPLLNAIQSHLQDTLRGGKARNSAAGREILATNAHAPATSDAYFIEVADHGGGRDVLQSIWLNTSSTRFENDFDRTEFNGNTQLLLAGFDFTVSERYVFGLAVGYESGTIDTAFNVGGQDIQGYTISPYFAYLMSDEWSVDLSLSLGQQDTDQSRAAAPALIASAVDSDFSSERNFVASNLTYSAPRGNWYLTGWLGLLVGEKQQDDYVESDSTAVEGQDFDLERWYLGGEAAYGHDTSETYFGLIYEKDTDLNEIEFDSGEQPANDDDNILVTIGWRYFGSDLTANIELSSRVGYDDASETTIGTTLRIDL